MPALHPGTGEADLFRHLRLALEAQAECRVARAWWSPASPTAT